MRDKGWMIIVIYVLISDVIITGKMKVGKWERGLMRDKGEMRIGNCN